MFKKDFSRPLAQRFCFKRFYCDYRVYCGIVAWTSHIITNVIITVVNQNVIFLIRLIYTFKWSSFGDSIEKSLWQLVWNESPYDFTKKSLCDSPGTIIWRRHCKGVKILVLRRVFKWHQNEVICWLVTKERSHIDSTVNSQVVTWETPCYFIVTLFNNLSQCNAHYDFIMESPIGGHMIITRWLQCNVACDSSQINIHNDFSRESPNDDQLRIIMRRMKDIPF